MAISKEKKVEIYKNINGILNDSKSVVFVNFKGLGVKDTTDLRKKLRGEDVNYIVAKKTLVKRALGELSPKGDMPQLDGELALAYSNDLIAPARGVYDFQKGFKDKIAILGGIFEGKYMDKMAMTEIASIPPIKVLYGQFVNVINSPIQGLVVALDKIAEKKS
ncbi:50S ribosomal protein L10 [Candidatus Campbellbacteria bacterium RIFOXYC2_FULL_35_25]|uniref:Large ribosomal subunit protein uL10 n=1 Tax=Candidatus Campbellbacteria bacterium RIFOXYC2_FULL_35_25 TaxID=1797582 RepID=A0A1F5EI01_9BACT|nr:MAG: 50S ribosomal protein L10 [Candidatus Campbellbacteria bacterium RIFOXYC2_FULL_35_25]